MFTKKAGKPFAKLNFEEFTGQAGDGMEEVFVKSTEVLQTGAVIELLAKVELDSRTETKRLTAEKIKTINKPSESSNQPDENLNNNSSYQNGSTPHPASDEQLILNVYLKSGVHDSSDLYKIRYTLLIPDDSVCISYTASNGTSIWLDPGSRYLVNDNERLRAELASWLKYSNYYL